MKNLAALGLIFVGLWGIAYNSNPQAFGTHARSTIGFALLAVFVTGGIGLLLPARRS